MSSGDEIDPKIQAVINELAMVLVTHKRKKHTGNINVTIPMKQGGLSEIVITPSYRVGLSTQKERA